jgi:hypothetical protein
MVASVSTDQHLMRDDQHMAHWHWTRDEQDLSPLLVARIDDGRLAHISDKRGILEWCNADKFSDDS